MHTCCHSNQGRKLDKEAGRLPLTWLPPSAPTAGIGTEGGVYLPPSVQSDKYANPGAPGSNSDSVFTSLGFLLSHFSRVRLFATPWTQAHPAALSVDILQARILEWAAIFSSRGIFSTQELNPCLLCLLPWQAGSLPLEPPRKQFSQ